MNLWYLGWLPLGILAFAFVIANLFRTAIGRRRGWQALLFASLTCGALELLCEYQMVSAWVQAGDWSALMDVVPAAASLSAIALCLGILLNAAALGLNLRAEKTAEAEEQ